MFLHNYYTLFFLLIFLKLLTLKITNYEFKSTQKQGSMLNILTLRIKSRILNLLALEQ